MTLLRNFLCIFVLIAAPFSASAQDLRIAAASDLQFVLPDLAAQYEKQSGQKLALTFGSSGNFFAQIQNGAPFDIFFSADASYPMKLIDAGQAEPGSYSIYARGRIVIWVPSQSPLDPAASGWDTLLDSRVAKISIANPEHAPYGTAAVAALQKAGLYDKIQSKLVMGENISQAAQFVQSGGAQAGIIAYSLALSSPMKDGKRWEIPLDSYPPLEQAVVQMKSSPNKTAAAAFLAFLTTDTARATFARYGFTRSPATAGQKTP
jgi:molybdate transport system substrate-binding protein